MTHSSQGLARLGPGFGAVREPTTRRLSRRGRSALGAKRYPWRYRPADDFVVLGDRDGNLFCVVQLPN